MRWRRLDVSGREEARVEQTDTGWRLTGQLDVEEADVSARLRYTIDCDAQWLTRSALIEGTANEKPLRFALEADGAGNWTRDGASVPQFTGALDVDLGFTPATNTLPIRRLTLSVGETAPVRSAWLRFPELRLEGLEQTYTRETRQSFRYQAQVDGEPFTARLDTDAFGRVLRYEGLWEAELAEPGGLNALGRAAVMKCEQCGQREAVMCITRLHNGSVILRPLCQACAVAEGIEIRPVRGQGTVGTPDPDK